jgi:hypothetical protein
MVDELIGFAEMAENPLTVSRTSQGNGLITYDITVPATLKSIIILDASWPIRRLAHYDKTIQKPLSLPSNLKAHGRLTVNFVRAPAGRSTVQKSLVGRKKSPYIQFVIEALQQIPDDEGVIIFCFKQRGAMDHLEALRRAISAAGIGVNALLADGNRRINFLTWGQETSRSNLSHCTNVIFAGIAYRGHLDLAACITGQAETLLLNPSAAMIEEVLLREAAHSIYQAINRAACRRVTDGEAHATTVWLPMADDSIRPLLEQVMPGMRWKPVRMQSLGKGTLTESVAVEIAAFLNSVPRSRDRVLVKDVRASLPELKGKASGSTLTAATLRAAELAGWEQRERTLFRVS